MNACDDKASFSLGEIRSKVHPRSQTEINALLYDDKIAIYDQDGLNIHVHESPYFSFIRIDQVQCIRGGIGGDVDTECYLNFFAKIEVEDSVHLGRIMVQAQDSPETWFEITVTLDEDKMEFSSCEDDSDDDYEDEEDEEDEDSM